MQENELKDVQAEEVTSNLPKENEKKSFIKEYFRGMKYDFIQSFKYNNMKLAGLLILIPGAIFGFFLTFHTVVVNSISVDATDGAQFMADLSGFELFMMMLFAILNIFTGFSVMNKRNLGSVIAASVTSALVVAAGVMYFVTVFRWMAGVNAYYARLDEFTAALENAGRAGDKAALESYAKPFMLLVNGVERVEPFTGQSWYVYAIPAGKRVSEYFDYNFVLSLLSVGACMICSVLGCILGFKNYDRNYQKVDR
jgi:hypothetical protein